MFRGLLLDFYGTLVEEDDAIVATICEEISRTASGDANAIEVGKFWSARFSQAYRELHGPRFMKQRAISVSVLSDVVQQFGANLDPEELAGHQFSRWIAPPAFPETTAVLAVIREIRIPICIVSNIDRDDIERALAFHNFNFDHIVTSDDVRSYKPNPEIFEAALAKLNLNPNEVLHIGDSRSSDVIGANRLGIPVAWINRSQKSPPLTANFAIHSLNDLIPILSPNPTP
jgi:2-haloacid dehalogenase/putative hydrolase of the HAD superfamily